MSEDTVDDLIEATYRALCGHGYAVIWIAFAVSNVVGAALAYGWYRQGTWRDADVRGAEPEPGSGIGDELELEEVSTDD